MQTNNIEEIIKKVTEEILRSNSNISSNFNSNSSYNTLVIYNGGHKNSNEIISKIKAEYSNSDVVLSSSFINKYGKMGYTNVYENISFSDVENLVNSHNTIILPTLTVSTSAKIASLITDEPIAYLIFQAILKKKRVIAFNDSLKECAILNNGMRNIIEGYIQKLREFGIEFIESNCYSGNSPSVCVSQVCNADRETCTGCGLCVSQCPTEVQKIVDAGADRISSGVGLPDVSSGIGRIIDHTLLKADATEEEIRKICEEAREHTFASVCVNPTNVALAASLLKGTPVRVCTVIGFPLGATPPSVKAFEARNAISEGATEIDMVINIGALKSKNYKLVEEDIKAVVNACCGKVSKVILETALLTDEEKVKACALAKAAGADFVKTSTGFGPGGATVDDIKLMRTVVGDNMGVKASGGVRDEQTARQMVEAGASRIGASASVAIVKGIKGNTKGY